MVAILADMSFCLYLVHGVNGYMLMSFLDQHGVDPTLCILIAVAASLVGSYLLYRFCEKPLSRFLTGKRKQKAMVKGSI